MNRRSVMRNLGVAVVVSLSLHLVAMSGNWLPVPERPAAVSPLEARLERAAPPPTVVPVAERLKAPSRPRPSLPRTEPPAATAALAAAGPFVLPPETQAEPEPPAPGVEAPVPEPAVPESTVVATAPSSTLAQEFAPVRTFPRKGRITYTLLLGADGFSVGRTVQSWEVAEDGYKLGSVSETTGIVEIFRAQRLVYMSEGKVTPRGLRPENFLMSRTRRGQTEEAQARFDWEAGRIRLGKAPHQRDTPLPSGSQDIVSFIYQFALAPPDPGRIRVPITNGSRIETYELEVMPEETLETPLGAVKTLPLKQIRQPGAESIEVWLAVEYRHLPVRIRFFDREGNPSGEQIASEIRISEQ